MARCGKVRVQEGLEQTLALPPLRTESDFLGGFAEDMGDRMVSAVTVPSARADCGVVAEMIEDLAEQEALCVLVGVVTHTMSGAGPQRGGCLFSLETNLSHDGPRRLRSIVISASR